MKYLVSRIAYEYNDETYEQSEDGTVPVLLFDTEKAANAEVDKLEAKERKGMDADYLQAYCGCWEDKCDHKNVKFFTVIPVREGNG